MNEKTNVRQITVDEISIKENCLNEFFYIYLRDPDVTRGLVNAKNSNEVDIVLKEQYDKMKIKILFGEE